jgi:hypothetical protein
MLSRLLAFLKYATGERTIEIDQESREHLILRYGARTTVFVRPEAKFKQNSKLVGRFAEIEDVELRKSANEEPPVNWTISVRLSGKRCIEIGQVTDETDASIIAARVAAVTGREVVVKI